MGGERGTDMLLGGEQLVLRGDLLKGHQFSQNVQHIALFCFITHYRGTRTILRVDVP